MRWGGRRSGAGGGWGLRSSTAPARQCRSLGEVSGHKHCELLQLLVSSPMLGVRKVSAESTGTALSVFCPFGFEFFHSKAHCCCCAVPDCHPPAPCVSRQQLEAAQGELCCLGFCLKHQKGCPAKLCRASVPVHHACASQLSAVVAQRGALLPVCPCVVTRDVHSCQQVGVRRHQQLAVSVLWAELVQSVPRTPKPSMTQCLETNSLETGDIFQPCLAPLSVAAMIKLG